MRACLCTLSRTHALTLGFGERGGQHGVGPAGDGAWNEQNKRWNDVGLKWHDDDVSPWWVTEE